MKKSELLTGMVVKLRDETMFMVLNTEVGKVGISQRMNTSLNFRKYNPETLKCKAYIETVQDVINECEEGHITKVLTLDGKCPICQSKLIHENMVETKTDIPDDKTQDIMEIYTPKLNNDVLLFENYKGLIPPICWGLMNKIWERNDKD